LQHFQQACTVRGALEVDRRSFQIDGFGFRDRTWGFRDESAQWLEYTSIFGFFDGVFVSAMKFLHADGTMRSDGRVIAPTADHGVVDLSFRRNAAAQFLAANLTLDDGSSHRIHATDRHTGFFVPMGADTEGPAFGAYDDFMSMDYDGERGGGFCEQGIIHRVC
jgi:hypothetical protein